MWCERVVRLFAALATLSALSTAGCIQVTSTSNAPNTFEKAQTLCRDQSEFYDKPDEAFVRCMQRLGYNEIGPEDY